jgi:hypothetical protein
MQLEGEDDKETTSLMSHEALIAEIKRLRERLITLESENASMSIKLSQQQWEVCYYSIRYLSPLNFYLYRWVMNLTLRLLTLRKWYMKVDCAANYFSFILSYGLHRIKYSFTFSGIYADIYMKACS